MWARCMPGEQWVGLPVGAVLMGSFGEVAVWQTQQSGAAREEMRAARDRKRCQQQKMGSKVREESMLMRVVYGEFFFFFN